MIYVLGFGCDQKKFSKSIFHSAFKFFMWLHHSLLLFLLCGTQGFEVLPFGSIQGQCFCFPPAFCSSPSLVLFPIFFAIPLLCTLKVPVQCLSFYCNLWITQCMASSTPFSFLYLLFSRHLFFLCHNSSFEVLTVYMTFQFVVGISLQSLGVNYLSVQLLSVFHTCTVRRN